MTGFALDFAIATGIGAGWIGIALIARKLEQRRIERDAARTPLANRYATPRVSRVWR